MTGVATHCNFHDIFGYGCVDFFKTMKTGLFSQVASFTLRNYFRQSMLIHWYRGKHFHQDHLYIYIYILYIYVADEP